MEREEALKTGTTTVAITYKGGVVLAADMRATMGTLIAHKATKKLFRIDDHLGMTIAGLVGDAQTLVRYMKAEIELYRLKNKVPMSVKASSTLMANILGGRRHMPYWVQLIVGGVDDDGSHVFSLDAAGGCIPDTYATSGSGSPYVYGILEDHFKEDMKMKETQDLAIRSISVAMRRDAASGNGITLGTIDAKGFRFLDAAEIAKRRSKMGFD